MSEAINMIDQIWLQPAVHFWTGLAVVITTLLSLLVTVTFAIRKQKVNRVVYAVLLLTQVSLMVQVLVGIKLLDQGLGPLQLYIHYVGGLGALFFYVLLYWLPQRVREQRWTAFSLSTLGFLFALMAFGIGSSYVAQGA